MTPEQSVEKWARAELSEKAASAEHFIDICRLIADPGFGWGQHSLYHSHDARAGA